MNRELIIKNWKLNNEQSLMVENNMKIVNDVINKHYRSAVKYCRNDLIQNGYIGLMKAVKVYTEKEIDNVSFSTVAYRYIKNEINRYLMTYESLQFNGNRPKYLAKADYSFHPIINSLEEIDENYVGGVSEWILEDTESTKPFLDIENYLTNKKIISSIKTIIGEKNYQFLLDSYSKDENRCGGISRQAISKKRNMLIKKIKQSKEFKLWK